MSIHVLNLKWNLSSCLSYSSHLLLSKMADIPTITPFKECSEGIFLVQPECSCSSNLTCRRGKFYQ